MTRIRGKTTEDEARAKARSTGRGLRSGAAPPSVGVNWGIRAPFPEQALRVLRTREPATALALPSPTLMMPAHRQWEEAEEPLQRVRSTESASLSPALSLVLR